MKKVNLGVVLLFSSLITLAQLENDSNEKRIKLGFNVGLNRSDLREAETLPADAAISNNLGFRLGFLANYTISSVLSLSPKAEISFNDSKVSFGDTQEVYEVPANLELMTHLIFKNENMKLSPYFFFGPNIKIPVSDNSANYSTNTDFAIDFGFGIEKAFRKLNFSPEARYSYGLLDINQHPLIRSLNFHNVALVFNFVGS